MNEILFYLEVSVVGVLRDHGPPHVHAIGPGAEAIFEIEDFQLVENHGFSSKAIAQIKEFLGLYTEILMEAWNEIHEEK